MKSYRKYDLYNNNTMRLHCIADVVYEPESTDELISLINTLKDIGTRYYILGAGSNVILPSKISTPIILTSNISHELTIQDDRVICGCSVRIQNLIRECQKKGLGGIEYLFSVPCSVGGAICMNAGTGRTTHRSISDFVDYVEYYDPDIRAVQKIDANNADFSFRHSLFQDKGWIIMRVVLKFPHESSEEVEEKIKARILFAREKQSGDKPSCGSVFNEYNSCIMRALKGLRIGGALWSKKTANWITNDKNASNKSILMLMWVAKMLHIILFQRYNVEVKIWK